ncbi:alpha-D-glucose phosphate-specific phosphoglucomutase [Paracoccus sp. p3-h83]|uniref:alpha-D-glucose phosphate-specific phosphoglucomutase n=1 Tax=Paracoccus sp. p3-h83 TaxID=3342805 RepID=UPI0035B6AFE7
MTVQTIPTQPISGQRPGTSGLRAKTATFRQPGYLENFVQATFDAIGGLSGKVLVLGGDGRFFGDQAVQVILSMAAANGAARVIVGQNGWLSTPAASNLIRQSGADGGIILSASHNPGGEDGDFGVKYNIANGGPAPEAVTEAIYARTQDITQYQRLDEGPVDLSVLGESRLGEMIVQVVDPVADYADLMETLVDFDAIRAWLKAGHRIVFDAMCAITGPYAVEIIENRLGAPKGSVIRSQPLPDFGGLHPDPNPTWAAELMETMFGPDAPDFGAASDGDGDRNMIVGRGAYVSPSDSLAVIAANAHLCPGYRGGIAGVARSMPTSGAADRVAAAMRIEAHETPTGWKFFGNLLDAGRVTICGEESFGTGSDHVREKDGLWAVLVWLNILAATGQGVGDLLAAHWARFGRNYYSRHDYEAIPTATAAPVFDGLRDRLPGLAGQTVAGLRVEQADEFSYHDPVDGSVSMRQGLRVIFDDGSRVVLRQSGTGTEGTTLRLYLERFTDDPTALDHEVQAALAPVIATAAELTGLPGSVGRDGPDVVT